MTQEPEQERETCAEDETSDDGKVKGIVFAAMDDIPRETTETKRQFAAEIEKSADHYRKGAQNEQRAAEVAKRIHESIIEERLVPRPWGLQILLANIY